MTNREFLKGAFKAFIEEVNCNNPVKMPIRIEDVDYITVHFKEGTPTNPERNVDVYNLYNMLFYNCPHYTEKIVMTEEWLDEEYEEGSNDNWIKCSDCLPDLDVEVLGTVKEYGFVMMLERKRLYDGTWIWIVPDDREGLEYKPDEIIAWMPVPKGFKEDKNG